MKEKIMTYFSDEQGNHIHTMDGFLPINLYKGMEIILLVKGFHNKYQVKGWKLNHKPIDTSLEGLDWVYEIFLEVIESKI